MEQGALHIFGYSGVKSSENSYFAVFGADKSYKIVYSVF